MEFLTNIRTVAKYEARILRRSWFFRLFSLGALFIFTFLNIGLFSPIGDEPWDLVAISSSVPLINLYLLNIGQAIVVIFLAADFLKRDKKLDTNEVLYTRSMSNLEYVTGKTWGILRLFIGLDIVILLIGLLMNIISNTMTIDLMSYVSFLLIISVPTILFSLGLAFVLMSVIKNQAVTFLLLLAIAAVNMFSLWHRFGSIFDYMAFGVPVFKSDMIGFDNLPFILNQRLLYFFLGIALVMLTVLLFRRLPQSKLHTALTIVLMVVFTAAATYCGLNTYGFYRKSIDGKKMVIETNRKFENSIFPSLTDAKIEVIHSGESIRATSDFTIRNNNREPLSTYIFSLNPGLNITKIISHGKELRFTRTDHIFEIIPENRLEPSGTDSLKIEYEGGIDESFCYPSYSDNIKENSYRIAMLNVNKRQAFLQEDYVLLTPETYWYPSAGLNYYPSNPARLKIDFTNYTLKVKDEAGLTSVSQGTAIVHDGWSEFTSEKPLTGLTLAIGNYRSDTLFVDSVRYINYYFPGHDYYREDLSEIKDTLAHLVSGIMRDFETAFSTKYPFKTLSLLEVPVQFHSFPRESSQTRAEVQPSVVLLPEKLVTIDNAGFRRRLKRQKKNNERNNTIVTDKELQFRLFNSFMRSTFMDGNSYVYRNGVARNEPTRYRLGPSFYYFRNNFYSSDYPVINAVFESHLQKINTPGQQGPSQEGGGDLTDNDRANLMLHGTSFSDLLEKRPEGDTLRLVVTLKGDWFFNMVRSKAGVEEFNKWFISYLNSHQFINIDLMKFNDDISKNFGFEFYPYLKDWFLGAGQPGFIFTNLKVNEIVVNDRLRYQVTFTASNMEHVAGIFNISFRTGGPGGRGGGMGPRGGQAGISRDGGFAMQGRGMETSDISKIVFLDSMETRKIGILLESQPRTMIINTLFSKNIPGQITMPVFEILKSKNGTRPFEGEEILPVVPDLTYPGEVIVDNEDPGFNPGKQGLVSPLKKLLGADGKRGEKYQTIRMYNLPESWQPVVGALYYGKYILSSVYTRAGKGERSITWSAPLKVPGYYDVYCYIGKAVDRMSVRSGGGGRQGGPGGPGGGPGGPGGGPGRQGQDMYKDIHYRIFHDEGIEEVIVDYPNSEGGWYNLGRYHLSTDSAKVMLSNQSEGRVVIGDAVRWVRQQ